VTLSPSRIFAGIIRNLFVLLLALSFPHFAAATISYQLSLANPGQHLFQVTMNIPDVHGEVQLQCRLERALRNTRFQQPYPTRRSRFRRATSRN
jgi:hypothetical protein